MTLRKLRINLLRLAFLPIVFVVVFVRPGWSHEKGISFSIELVGYVFLLAGLAIRMWCICYIGSRKSKELITEGPYSLCRNPLYIGTSLLAIGVGFSFENLLMILFVPLIIIPIHILTAKKEEAHLEGLFGDTYCSYKAKVPAFWPKFSNYHSPETVPIHIRSIQRIAMDTCAVLMLPMIEDLLELLHASGIIPVLWHIPN